MHRRSLIQTAIAGSTAFCLPGLAAPGRISAEDADEHLSADVVIVGAGFAGLVCAVTSARAGALVLVLEKRAYAGGDGILSAGIIASSRTPLHDEAGISKDVNFEAYWRRIEEGIEDESLSKVRDNLAVSPIYSGIFKHDPQVLRRCAETSPEVVAFRREFGVQFLPINPNQPFLLPARPGSMPSLAAAMMKELEKRGVRILTRVRATRLIKGAGKTSSVTGVLAESSDGRTLRADARAVVIATGGFTNKSAMMKRYKRFWADVPVGFTAVGEGVPPGHDGDGIVMGLAAGAALEDMESIPKFYAAPRKGQRSPSWILFDTDTAYLVDRSGSRFCNEKASRYSGCAVKCYADGIREAFVVFDEATFRGPGRNRWGYEKLLAEGGLFKGETVEEAAMAAGVDPRGLRRTIEDIGRDAEKGVDRSFGRTDALFRALKGPFYVSAPSSPIRFKSEGGLEVNPNFEVLAAADAQPIPGLYAVGATCGSISTRLCDVMAGALIAGRLTAEAVKRPNT